MGKIVYDCPVCGHEYDTEISVVENNKTSAIDKLIIEDRDRRIRDLEKLLENALKDGKEWREQRDYEKGEAARFEAEVERLRDIFKAANLAIGLMKMVVEAK